MLCVHVTSLMRKCICITSTVECFCYTTSAATLHSLNIVTVKVGTQQCVPVLFCYMSMSEWFYSDFMSPEK